MLAAGSAGIEIRTGGTWRHIGDLHDGYADVKAGDANADAVRLTWASGSPAPSISDIVFVTGG